MMFCFCPMTNVENQSGAPDVFSNGCGSRSLFVWRSVSAEFVCELWSFSRLLTLLFSVSPIPDPSVSRWCEQAELTVHSRGGKGAAELRRCGQSASIRLCLSQRIKIRISVSLLFVDVWLGIRRGNWIAGVISVRFCFCSMKGLIVWGFPSIALPNPAEVILTAAALGALRLVLLHAAWCSWEHFQSAGAASRADAAVAAQGATVAGKVRVCWCWGRGGWPETCKLPRFALLLDSKSGPVVLVSQWISCLRAAAAEGAWYRLLFLP